MRILVCDSIHEDGVNMLKAAGYNVELDTKISGVELVDKIGDYDAIIIRSRTNVDERVLRVKGRLKAIARAGVGLDNVDLETAKKMGIQVINSPEAPSNSVAELVLGLMLALARRIPEGDASMKRGEWIKRQLTGFELKGKTLGIIGFGRIGYELGKKCKALGMTVVAYDVAMDRLIKYVEEIKAESVTMEELLSGSDFVSLHVPLLPQTRNLIGRDQIGLMKKSAYLINAARGGIIDEMALRDALVKGKLGGAALDVFANEPPDNTSLTGLKNIICMPHIGAATIEAQRANSTIVAEKLIQFFS
jgi:D-3-phosphoglycerate dehydrogenase